MKFKQFLEESRFITRYKQDKESETYFASEFLKQYKGNIFPIDTGKHLVNFEWTIHAMHRFIERGLSTEVVQEMLMRIADASANYPYNQKLMIYSNSLKQGIVILKKKKDLISIVTVYPNGDIKINYDDNLILVEGFEIPIVFISDL